MILKCSTRLLEKWKISLDSGGKVGAICLDLSKAFDCLRLDLLLAKLDACGLSHGALTFIPTINVVIYGHISRKGDHGEHEIRKRAKIISHFQQKADPPKSDGKYHMKRS